MTKKTFFKERTANEIQELSPKQVYIQRGLVERIDDLSPVSDALEIRVRITPGEFFRGDKSGTEASRKCFKHGDLIALEHPKTQGECYETSEIPLAMRARSFAKLQGMKEEEINFVGYSVQPSWGDRLQRVFPFAWQDEGVRLFGYGETYGGIKIESYDDAKRVKSEGANVVVEVPSRTKKQLHYKIKLLHV